MRNIETQWKRYFSFAISLQWVYNELTVEKLSNVRMCALNYSNYRTGQVAL